MASTYEEIMAKSRELYGTGDIEGAKRLAKIAVSRKSQPEPAPQAPAPDMSILAPSWEGVKKGLQVVGQTADDAVRGAANGVTFGLADRFAAMMNGQDVEGLVRGESPLDRERRLSSAAQERSPVAYTGGEIAGAVAGAGKLASMGATAGNLIPAGLTGIKGVLARAAAGGVDSLALNEAMNAGNGRDFGENAGLAAVTGAIAPGAGELISKGASKALGAFTKGPASQSVDDVMAATSKAANAAYKQADEAGGVFTAPEFSARVSKIKEMLAEDAYLPGNQPGVKEALSELDRLDGQNITFKGLEATRRKIRGGYNPLNKDNNRMLYGIIDEIDDFAATGGSGLYPEARKLYAQKSKMESVRDALEQGKKRAALTGSGGNTENATRQRLDKVAQKMRGATPDEKAALETAAYGTPGRNIMRAIGRAAPSNGALPLIANVAAGFATMEPTILAASLGSEGAKRLSERATTKAAEKVIKIIGAGGNAAALEAPKNAAQKAIEAKKQAIARLLMSGGLVAAGSD